MNDIDVTYLTDAKRINVCRDLKLWTLEQFSQSLSGMVSTRSTQLMCSEDSRLKPPLIQALSSVFGKPEYQFLAVIPKTYIFNGRYINSGRIYANVLQSNPIIDVKWGEAHITDNKSFEYLLSLIDDSHFKIGPLTNQLDNNQTSSVSFQARFQSFERNKSAFDDFCSKNEVQVWGIPVFKVFKTSEMEVPPEQASFIWKIGVIIEFYKYQVEVEKGGRFNFPTFADTVGEEQYYVGNTYFGNEPRFEKRALDSRQDLLTDGNVNFGSLEIDKILYDKSTATVARALPNIKSPEENIY